MCHELISSNFDKLKKQTFPSFEKCDWEWVPDRAWFFFTLVEIDQSELSPSLIPKQNTEIFIFHV